MVRPSGQAALIPHALTGLRALSAPLLWWLVTSLQLEAAFVCLAFAVMSDAIDGPLMRRIGTPSAAGGYFDASADCAVIVGGFCAFARIGVYPAWTVALIGVVFLNFLVTSRLTPAMYDPIGRHIGGLLFLCIGATLLLPDFLFQALLLLIITVALVATLIGRLIHTVRFFIPRAAAIGRLSSADGAASPDRTPAWTGVTVRIIYSLERLKILNH